MKKIITFYDLSKDFSNIEIELANWLFFNINVNVVLFENDNTFSHKRKKEIELFSEDCFHNLVDIFLFNDYNDLPNLIQTLNQFTIVSKINFGNNPKEYLKNCTVLYILLDKVEKLEFATNLKNSLKKELIDLKIDFIFIDKAISKKSEFLFYDK